MVNVIKSTTFLMILMLNCNLITNAQVGSISDKE